MVKPNSSSELVKLFINQRLNTVSDRKVNWSGLYKQGVIYMNAPYTEGAITFNFASDTITGTATAWPISDIVNTVIAQGVPQPGERWIVPGSMANIGVTTQILVDGSETPEIITPLETTPTSFRAIFNYTHNPNCTLTVSSLTGCQLKTSISAPIFTVTSVRDVDSLTIDSAYFGEAVVLASYSITKFYVEMDPGVKCIMGAQDKQDGYPMRVQTPRAQLDVWDPQRTATGQPLHLCDMGPMPSGNIGYEVWPPTQTDRQIIYECYTQPTPLVRDTDRPPPFMNPSMLLYGVYADLLRTRIPTNGDGVDPWYDPATANFYEKKFESDLAAAMNADGSKTQTQFTWDQDYLGVGGGANWFQSHDLPGFYGNY